MTRLCPAALLAAALALAASAGLAQENWPERSLELVNSEREAEGLDPLQLDAQLVAAAKSHADDMLARDYYDHVSPEGETVRDRFIAQGGSEWLLVSENIAMCRGCPTPPGAERVEAFHQGWMDSPEHRATILDPGLEEFGFAMSSGGDVVYGVQTFAGPGGQGDEEAALDQAALVAEALAAVNRAREERGLEPLEASDGLQDAASRLTEGGAVAEPEGGLGEVLPETGWSAVGMAAVECGGCGTVPTAADIDRFVSDWLADPALSGTLLDPAARQFGFALEPDGEGRKAAVALVGTP